EQTVTERDVRDRWLDLSMYTKPPMKPQLSGLNLEYLVIQLYSRDAGKREARVSFNVGQGTQDIGFRNDVDILFTCLPSTDVTLRVLDEQRRPTTASSVMHRGMFIHRRRNGSRPTFTSTRRYTAPTVKRSGCRRAITPLNTRAGRNIWSGLSRSKSLLTNNNHSLSDSNAGLMRRSWAGIRVTT